MVSDTVSPELEAALHRTIKKVTDDIEAMKFNTAIAAMMALLNEIHAAGSIDKESLKTLAKLLCPFAPHICEEVWAELGGEGFCSAAEWPVYDEAKTKVSSVEIAVQICGKLRGKITIPAEATEEEAFTAVMADESLASLLNGKQIVKKIYVKGRLFNIVAK
jgi:leucyl-tRNA synthetase